MLRNKNKRKNKNGNKFLIKFVNSLNLKKEKEKVKKKEKEVFSFQLKVPNKLKTYINKMYKNIHHSKLTISQLKIETGIGNQKISLTLNTEINKCLDTLVHIVWTVSPWLYTQSGTQNHSNNAL